MNSLYIYTNTIHLYIHMLMCIQFQEKTNSRVKMLTFFFFAPEKVEYEAGPAAAEDGGGGGVRRVAAAARSLDPSRGGGV
jgi:hypothetical protein